MSSIADLLKKQYEKGSEDKIKEKKELKNKKSVIETENMKRISLWLDKETFYTIQNLIKTLKNEPLAKVYANESELIRHLIKRGIPSLIEDFRKMFPSLVFQKNDV